MTADHYHFITGRLAQSSLRRTVEPLAAAVGFDYSIQVMPITVAALMSPKWIARRLKVPAAASRVIVPGYCLGDLDPIEQECGLPVDRGPKDLVQLPEWFGQTSDREGYGDYSIDILAEINHAAGMTHPQLILRARQLAADGADLIDLGCDPQGSWSGIGDAVKALRDEGFRASVDSYNPAEIGPAVRAGAELVLSVDKTNRRQACDWGCEVVVVPDVPGTLTGIEETLALLSKAGVSARIDPVLNPISFGFSDSLGRYLEARRRWPEAEMLMGVGNLTELTDVDSAAVNVLLLGFCQEQRIGSVLTTEEINWARTSVRELDLARRLVHYAVARGVLPKHIEPGLVMLRDARLLEHGPDTLRELAAAITDRSYRIFVEGGRLHVITSGMHLEGDDPYDLFEQLELEAGKPLEPSHAFYLGYEMAKAMTALTLGKNYRQDEALDWGMLTRPELTRRQRRALRMARRQGPDDDCTGDVEEDTCD